MPVSLHSAAIPTMLQILGAGKGWLDKAAASGIAEQDIAEATLIDDMLPFKYQMKSMAVHSRGAIEGLRKGTFSPDMGESPATFAGMRDTLDGAIASLQGVTEEEVEGFVGQDMFFVFGERKVPFTGENFLLSFSLANFFFHATTAYDILRAKGVEVGKRDFLGALRIKA